MEQLKAACGPHGEVGEVSKLLKEGVPADERGTGEWTALHTACFYNRADIVKVLLKYSPNVNQQTTSFWQTPIHIACKKGSMNCVKLLLQTGQCDLGNGDMKAACTNYHGR